MNQHRPNQKPNKLSDSEWIVALSGKGGEVAQAEAVDALARYLFIVVYNYLLSRRRGIASLDGLANDELSSLAQDFIQRFMEKMVREQYSLLDKYHGDGRFTKWASQVMLNLIRSEFRKARWSRLEPLYEYSDSGPQGIQAGASWESQLGCPVAVLLNGQLRELLQQCIAKLPSRMQRAFIRRIIDGESATVVAAEMGVTPDAIHMLVYRAKKMMQRLLLDDDLVEVT